MKTIWACLLLLAVTSGCGTIAGYQASPRWKVIVTDAEGRPRGGCEVSLSWYYYFGREDEKGSTTKFTGENGEASFEAVVLRPNVGKIWRGRAAGALNIHASYGPRASVLVSKTGFERMRAYYPSKTPSEQELAYHSYDIHLEDGIVVSRFVMMPPKPPETLAAAIRVGDLNVLGNELHRNRYYATNTAQAAALLHAVIQSSGGQGQSGVPMANLIVAEWKSAHPKQSGNRLDVAGTWVKSYGTTPMEGAVKAKRRDVVEALLATGASPDTPQVYFYPKNPPLHLAVASGDVEMVKLLLRYKANVNQKREGGETSLDLAEAAGQTEIVEVLRAAGARKGTTH